MHRKSIATLLSLLLAFVLVLATVCGDDDNGSAATTSTTTAKGAHRIVSLSATATEMLYAINAGDRVVAVDDQSNYPANAPRTKLSGLQPNVEAITKYNPDLVVAATDPGDLAKGLQKLKIKVLMQPAARTLDDTYAQLTELGNETGHEADAKKAVDKIQLQIAELKKSVPASSKPLTYYHELDDTYYSVTSDTFIGQVYKLAGLQDIADATKDKAGGYPQLSPEFILHANPDVIFLADTKCCNQSAKTVAARPGWSGIAAVKNGHVVLLDDDIASRWGPRVVDLFKVVIDAVKQAAPQKAAA